MTTNESGDRSLSDIFGNLQLSGSDSLVAPQEDPCKMPQSDPNDSCDDARDTSSIIVVDSDASSVLSFIDPDELVSLGPSSDEENSSDNVLAITIEETESEPADEHGVSGGSTTSQLLSSHSAVGSGTAIDSATKGADMDSVRSSKSLKVVLKRSSYSLSDDDSPTKKRKLDAISGAELEASRRGLKRASPLSQGNNFTAKKSMEEMTASSSSPKIVTRSGRAVRMRLDKKFDYSSSQPEDDESQDSSSSSPSDSDDEEFQLNGSNVEPNWSSRKRRRSSHGSSRTSSSTGSSSQLEAATLIYLDLEPPVATIMHEPFANLILDDDADLKTKIHKFLGLIPRRRRLYNPEDHLEPDEPPHTEAEPSGSLLLITCPSAQPAQPEPPLVSQVPQVPPSPMKSPMGVNASLLQKLTLEERKAKMLDDTMLLINASTIQTETPEYIKAPIDLTDLPSEKCRANNCRRHKGCIACLEQHPLFYSFVDSLNPATSIKLCHPQALTYRKSDFESCKQALAKLLFNIFNHAVFHCALQPDIVWKRTLEKPCRCEMTINSSGQRSARLLLWQNINHPGQLIKPLLHEMCHAAAFVFNRETGHGEACRQWAYQANQQMMELTLIDVCNARFKYVCTMCGRGSYGLMNFAADKEMLRCHYCQFEVVVEPWSSDCAYDCIRPDTTMTSFKTFVAKNYQQLAEQEAGKSHSDNMRCLNQQYLEMKLQAACD